MQGTVINFEDDGRIVNFKPLNIEGYTDTLSLDASDVVRYFDVGEKVIITEGKYQGEPALVVEIDKIEKPPTKKDPEEGQMKVKMKIMVTVKIESSQRELKITTASLKKKTHSDMYLNPLINQSDRKQGKA